MTFSNRVKILVLVTALLPALLGISFTVFTAASDLHDTNQNRLVAVRNVKLEELNRLFQRFARNVESIAVTANEIHPRIGQDDYHHVMSQLCEQLGFYDIFIINSKGDVVYTVAREADYQSNLYNGPYASSNLGKLFQKLEQGSVKFAATDFEPYAPSNNEPAGFMGVPVQMYGERWVVATQVSTDKIDVVMRGKAGLGKSGETILVGSDFRMRSDSVMAPDTHNIKASFAGSIEKNGVKTHAVQAALQGQTGVEKLTDYHGVTVLSAYAPVDYFGMTWAVLAEIELDEIEASTYHMINLGIGVLVVAAAVALAAAIWITRIVMTPLGAEPTQMKALMAQVAAGDLSMPLARSHNDSVNDSLALMVANLNEALHGIRRTAIRLSATSEELSVVTREAEKNIEQQSRELDMSASAVEELATSIRDVARNANEAASTTDAADEYCRNGQTEVSSTIKDVTSLSQRVEQGYQGVSRLAEHVEQISGVLDVIRGVADQTNLLALNAAIEAARAGENGRGFAVVADEVRNLAQRTQQSTVQIESMISEVTQQSTTTVGLIQGAQQLASATVEHIRKTGNSIERINKELANLQTQSSSVSAATEQQATVASQVGVSVTRIRDLASETVAGAQQTSASSEELAGMAHELNMLVENFRLNENKQSYLRAPA